MCVSWESSPPEQERSVLTVRERLFVCVCARPCVRVCTPACAYAFVRAQVFIRSVQ